MALTDTYSVIQNPDYGVGPRIFWLSMLGADLYFWVVVIRRGVHLFQ